MATTSIWRVKGWLGKDISVRPSRKERFVRLARNFGEAYSIEGIRRRILGQNRAARPKPPQEERPKRYRYRGRLRAARRITGFRALYFHYCYLLGVFPKDRPQNRRRLHFLLREDLGKLDAITKETRLLVSNRIDTAPQLLDYQKGLEMKIKTLTNHRGQLYKLQRTAEVKTDAEKLAAVKAQISVISKELSMLRREVKLCDGIALRSGVMREKLNAVRADEKSGKEKNQYVQFRRRGGTGRAVEP